MKKSQFKKLAVFIVFVMFIALAKSGHINMPGHGNWENKNFRKLLYTMLLLYLALEKKLNLAASSFAKTIRKMMKCVSLPMLYIMWFRVTVLKRSMLPM